MKLPKLSSLRHTRKGIIAAAVVVLGLGGAGFTYAHRNTSQTINNANGSSTTKLTNPISTTSSNTSNAGTIDVPCACKLKNSQTQPGQTSTSGTSLQNGSAGSTQVQVCNPCPTDSTTSSAVACPEVVCKVPVPTPAPTPSPAPTPTPITGCGTCGGRDPKAGATSSMYACPMYCVE